MEDHVGGAASIMARDEGQGELVMACREDQEQGRHVRGSLRQRAGGQRREGRHEGPEEQQISRICEVLHSKT